MTTVHPSLAGRTAVILGGTGGVGEGIVRQYLRAGANVVVPSRTESSAERFRARLADEDTGALHLHIGPYGTFDEAEARAAEITEGHGAIDDVVASIGGWWMGAPVWGITEADWNQAFVGLATAHVAAVRAFLPRMSAGGAYTLILGGSAVTPVPGSGIVSMEQAALLMMRSVLSAEAGEQRRIHSLVLGPVVTRHRRQFDPDWVSAEQVGDVAVAISAHESAAGGDLSLRSQADVRDTLAAIRAEEGR